MHFGDIVKLAKNGQYFISRILLYEAEVSLASFWNLEIWCQEFSGPYNRQT